MTLDKTTSEELCKIVRKAIDDKKGYQVVTIDLREINEAVCDYFVLCSADSSTQVSAISDAVEKAVKDELKLYPIGTEGKSEANWTVIDYFDVVVHVFHREARAFYQLEELWSDAPQQEHEEINE